MITYHKLTAHDRCYNTIMSLTINEQRRFEMGENILPSINLLRDLLEYDPNTGMLYWKSRTEDMFYNGNTSSFSVCKSWNSRWSGKPALNHIDARGYKRGAINGRHLQAHRVIWAICNGSWPKGEIDHINGNKIDNRISNLRVASRSQNERNKGLISSNTSGEKGVSWNKLKGKWHAYVTINRKRTNVGYFDCRFKASLARKEAAEKLHGEFVRHL